MQHHLLALALVASAAAAPRAAAQGVTWETYPLPPGRVATYAHDVLFLPDLPLDEGGLIWISDYGPLAWRPGHPDNWGLDWDNLCGDGCSPNVGLLTTQGTLLISADAGSATTARRPQGGAWEEATGHLATLHQTALPSLRGPDGHGALVGGTYTSILSFDDGKPGSWTSLGDTGGEVEAFFDVPPSDSLPEGRLLAAVWNGVTLSDDGGHSWQAAAGLYGFARYITEGFAWLPEEGHSYGGTLLAGVNDLEWGYDSTATVYRSEDGGASWARIHRFSPSALGLENTNHAVFAVLPDGVVWAGVTHRKPGKSYERPGAMARSFDGGTTWEPMSEGYGMHGVAALRLGLDGRLYAASARGLWRTAEAVYVASDRQPEAERLRLSVRPNPSRQRVTLELAGADHQPVEVVVVDAQGREVARRELAAGSSWRVDVSEWAPGVYHARAGGDHQLEAVSFTVVR